MPSRDCSTGTTRSAASGRRPRRSLDTRSSSRSSSRGRSTSSSAISVAWAFRSRTSRSRAKKVLGRSSARGNEAGLVWEDVLGMASRNSRPIARYLAFMLVPGVIASYGVLEYNVILIVGAMAISPDLLPITAVGVGLVDRRLRLAGRAFLTLAIGMAFTSAAAAVSSFVQDQLNAIPAGFNIDSTVLGSLTHVNNETIAVALAAGVAGMLALETRASSGVGVAVSVTTIPAAAYLGVALGLGEHGEALGAFAVLATNVALLVVSASATLGLQRALARRAAIKREREATTA